MPPPLPPLPPLLLPLLLPELDPPLDDPLEDLPASVPPPLDPPLEDPLEPPLDDPLEEPPASFPPLVPPDALGAAHTPAVHRPVQHSLPVVQSDPFDEQVAPSHFPATQLWLQHEVLAVQAEVSAAQAGWSHVLFVQDPPQQSLPWLHAPPEGAQGSTTHLPELQSLLQQSLGDLQLAPVAPQTVETPEEGLTEPGAGCGIPYPSSLGDGEQATTIAPTNAKERMRADLVTNPTHATNVPACARPDFGQIRLIQGGARGVVAIRVDRNAPSLPLSTILGEQPEGPAVGPPKGAEVAPIEREDIAHLVAPREHDDRCVGDSDMEGGVAFDHARCNGNILRPERLQAIRAPHDLVEKRPLR